jgi:DNA-binding response OmpR family regulator
VSSSLPHVLVVEDSELVSSALRILLESTGRRVTIAGSVRAADDAIAAAAAAGEPPIALALLDLTLADGDGLDVLARARARGAVPRVAVAMTGHDDDATRERCLAAGCTEVLVKPVPTRVLLARVDEWLDGAGSRA